MISKTPKTIFVSLIFLIFLSLNSKAQETNVLLERAKTAIEKNNIESALPDLNLIISREPSNEEALTQRARVFIIQKKVPEAAADSAKVLAMNPKNLFALNVRGMVKAANKDYSGAIADFNEVIKIDPTFFRSYYQRARAKTFLNYSLTDVLSDYNSFLKYNEAVSIFQEAGNYCLDKSGTPQVCAAYFDKIKLKEPNSFVGYLGYALAYANVYQTVADKTILKGEVINNFRRAIELNPKDMTAPQQLGRLQFNLEDYDGGIISLTKAIAVNPNNAWSYALRGDCFRMKEEYDKAIADYTKSLEIDPKNQSVYHFRAFAYNDKNVSLKVRYKTDAEKAEWEKVIADFQKAAELSNQNFEAYQRFYKLMDQLQQIDGSTEKDSIWKTKTAKIFDSMIAVNPNNVCAYFFASKFQRYSDSNGKEYHYNAVFKYDGKNGAQCSAEAAFWLGRTLAEYGVNRNESEALKFYNLALERVPNMPYVAVWKAKLSSSAYESEKSSGSSSSSSSSNDSQNNTEINPYKVESAIREYNKVHSQIETSLQQYLNDWRRYTRADPVMRSMMSGTRRDLVKAREWALSAIVNFLKEYGDYLPSSMSSHLTADGNKFTSLPF